jgi:phenylacetic acid degradation protein
MKFRTQEDVMPLYEFEGRVPRIDPTAWVAPSADVIGDVRIGPKCYIGWGVILRGDYGSIEIGEGSAIEEGVIIHARPNDKTVLGKEVTVGHGALIHNAIIEDYAVIGMRALISDYARIGTGAIVAEMGLVSSNQEVPAEVVALGQPVKVKRPIKDMERQMWGMGKKVYQDLARRNPQGIKQIGDRGQS